MPSSEQKPDPLGFRHSRPTSAPRSSTTANRRRRPRRSEALAASSESHGATVRSIRLPRSRAAVDFETTELKSDRSIVVTSRPSAATTRTMWTWSSSSCARTSITGDSGLTVLGYLTIASATRGGDAGVPPSGRSCEAQTGWAMRSPRSVVDRAGTVWLGSDVLEAEAALDAEVPARDVMVVGRGDLHDLIVLDMQREVAANTTVRTDRVGLGLARVVPGGSLAQFVLGAKHERPVGHTAMQLPQ